MNVKLICGQALIEPNGNSVIVVCNNFEPASVLKYLTPEEVVFHFGEQKLLEAIAKAPKKN